MKTKVDLGLLNDFLVMIRSIENNDFAERAVNCCRFTHSTLGIITEVAELKLHILHMKDLHADEFLLGFQDEIGDICFYLLQGMDIFGWTLEQMMKPRIRARVNVNDPIDGLHIVAGEIADVLKKHLVYNNEMESTRLMDGYTELWELMQLLVEDFGTTLNDCIAVTRAKLNLRYPTGKFRYEDRANRDRDAEKVEMERAKNE